MEIVTPLELDRPITDAVRNKKVVVANKDELLKKYGNYEPLDKRSIWLSKAVVPTFGNYVFVFRLQCKIEDNTFSDMYFQIVGTLLSLYRFDEAISRSATDKDVKKELYRPRVKKGSPLTERQGLIVKLIKDSKTNGQIAIALGYSESLIRQETIIIYQKLGINGRRELILQSES
jgi:DNA-binding CsgD family transcriptional regulator